MLWRPKTFLLKRLAIFTRNSIIKLMLPIFLMSSFSSRLKLKTQSGRTYLSLCRIIKKEKDILNTISYVCSKHGFDEKLIQKELQQNDQSTDEAEN